MTGLLRARDVTHRVERACVRGPQGAAATKHDEGRQRCEGEKSARPRRQRRRQISPQDVRRADREKEGDNEPAGFTYLLKAVGLLFSFPSLYFRFVLRSFVVFWFVGVLIFLSGPLSLVFSRWGGVRRLSGRP